MSGETTGNKIPQGSRAAHRLSDGVWGGDSLTSVVRAPRAFSPLADLAHHWTTLGRASEFRSMDAYLHDAWMHYYKALKKLIEARRFFPIFSMSGEALFEQVQHIRNADEAARNVPHECALGL